MKLPLLVIFGLFGTLNARLIEKNTNKTTSIDTRTPQVPPRVRLTRDIFEDDTFAGSKEDNGQSVEFAQSYSRKARDYFGPDSRSHPKIVIRKPRESHEKVDKHKNASAPQSPVSKTTKAVLVKKPIPKYLEMDYEDDFQMKVSGSSVKVADSGEHEDEDFNVDDYDFDVNHDEYVGRGKPLEPRVKHKEFIGNNKNRARSKPVVKATVPVIKIQNKPVVPTMPIATSKKGRAAPPRRPNEKNKEVDYYDDITSTVRTTERDKKDSDEDDGEDTREVISKVGARQARSPWKNSYIEKLGEKSSNLLASKLLGVLPMFPALNRRQMEYLRVSEEPTYY